MSGGPLDRRALLRGAGGLLAGCAAAALATGRGGGPGLAAPGATPVAGTGPATRGGTARVVSVGEPESLHPWQARSAAAADILDGVCDGLLRLDATGALQPALAESFAISDDGLTYRFALRKGVAFHNGEPFGGRDVVASWQAVADGRFGPAPAGWDRVVAVDAPRTAVAEFRLAAPYAPFLATVATTPLLPAGLLGSGAADLGERLARAPVGTGPFTVERWDAGREVGLARFAGWWGGGPPLDGIVVRFAPDRAAAAGALADRAADLVAGGGTLGLGPAADPVAAVPGATVVRHPTRTWHHLDLKQVGFLREAAVRQALDFAVPRDALFGEVLGGRGVPAFADQPPAGWAYDAALSPRPHDPAAAARLLDGAGLAADADGVRARDGEPFFVELWSVAGDPTAAAIAGRVAAAWRALGIVAVPRAAPAADLWGPLGYQFSDRMTACLYAWTNGNDPDNRYYWHASQIPKSPWGSGGNLLGFFHRFAFQEQIDGLIEAGIAAASVAERTATYHASQALLAEQAPALFLFWEEAFPAVAARLHGPRPNPHTGLLWNAGGWWLG